MNDTINLDVLLKTTCSLLRRLQTVFGWGCQQSVATIEGELQSGAIWAGHIGVIGGFGLSRYRNRVALPVWLFDRQLFAGLCGADYKATRLFLVIDIQIITASLYLLNRTVYRVAAYGSYFGLGWVHLNRAWNWWEDRPIQPSYKQHPDNNHISQKLIKYNE